MPSTGKFTLRPHQVEAVDAVVRGLDIPPGKKIPQAGLRATLVAACGTGKTFIAAHCALRLARHGRVLVLVPTLDLLTQTMREWRAAGHHGPAVAVCSLEDDPHLWNLKVRSTTSAPQLALWHGRGPVTVYATYASLPVLAEAHEGAYGLPMDVFDLVVVDDEAHRTSGSAGKAWAAVHDQDVIPAMRRLYMTATPRIWKERPPRPSRAQRQAGAGDVWDPLPREMACSMDDPKVFGPVVYELSLASAVSRGLLARYQIVVIELTDPLVTPARLSGPQKRDEDLRRHRLHRRGPPGPELHRLPHLRSRRRALRTAPDVHLRHILGVRQLVLRHAMQLLQPPYARLLAMTAPQPPLTLTPLTDSDPQTVADRARPYTYRPKSAATSRTSGSMLSSARAHNSWRASSRPRW
ncbi:DEAD/DEAH box helicase family protein [Streptomyces sp. NPDC087866]|uniref:DEAD/DEAH box helicase family protein n=1 Tax=Streptomyces sp. NPDC087866 TaxID=3365815 RepID=UPI003826457D